MAQISTLYRKSINSLSNWLVLQLHNRDLFSNSENVISLKKHLENLPITVKDELMDKLVNGIYYDCMLRVRALRILLCHRSRTLIISMPCEEQLTKHFLKVIRQQGRNLRHLELRALHLRPRDSKAFQIILHRLKKLQVFCINFKPQCGVFYALTKNVPHLRNEFKNPYPETWTFNSSHSIFMGILTELVITEAFPVSDLCEIVPQLPYLISLGNYAETGTMIEMLELRHIHLNLTHVYDWATSEETLKSIRRVCPKIKSLTLIIPSPKVFKVLPTFLHLRRLRIEHILAVGNNVFTKLRILELIGVGTELNLVILFESCPGLDFFRGEVLALEDNIPLPSFKHGLGNLFLKNVNCNQNSLKSIIYMLPYLYHLSLQNVLLLDKRDVGKFIERRFLSKLKSVFICSDNVPNVTRFDIADILTNNPEWRDLVKESHGYETFVIDLHNNDI